VIKKVEGSNFVFISFFKIKFELFAGCTKEIKLGVRVGADGQIEQHLNDERGC